MTLPNGLFGSVYIGWWRVSDSGLLNMSGLNQYLYSLLEKFNLKIPSAGNQLPAIYGDGIFPQLPTIVARYQIPDDKETIINRILSSARQSIEHIFALHTNVFSLFSIPQCYKLLVQGTENTKMILNLFFLLNCYICLNESPNSFDICPPSLDEYLPLDEELKAAPDVTENALREVYNYYV